MFPLSDPTVRPRVIFCLVKKLTVTRVSDDDFPEEEEITQNTTKNEENQEGTTGILDLDTMSSISLGQPVEPQQPLHGNSMPLVFTASGEPDFQNVPCSSSWPVLQKSVTGDPGSSSYPYPILFEDPVESLNSPRGYSIPLVPKSSGESDFHHLPCSSSCPILRKSVTGDTISSLYPILFERLVEPQKPPRGNSLPLFPKSSGEYDFQNPPCSSSWPVLQKSLIVDDSKNTTTGSTPATSSDEVIASSNTPRSRSCSALVPASSYFNRLQSFPMGDIFIKDNSARFELLVEEEFESQYITGDNSIANNQPIVLQIPEAIEKTYQGKKIPIQINTSLSLPNSSFVKKNTSKRIVSPGWTSPVYSKKIRLPREVTAVDANTAPLRNPESKSPGKSSTQKKKTISNIYESHSNAFSPNETISDNDEEDDVFEIETEADEDPDEKPLRPTQLSVSWGTVTVKKVPSTKIESETNAGSLGAVPGTPTARNRHEFSLVSVPDIELRRQPKPPGVQRRPRRMLRQTSNMDGRSNFRRSKSVTCIYLFIGTSAAIKHLLQKINPLFFFKNCV